MKKLLLLTLCCLMAPLSFGQGGLKQAAKTVANAKNGTGLLKWTGKVRCPNCPKYFSAKRAFDPAELEKVTSQLALIQSIRDQANRQTVSSDAEVRQVLFPQVAQVECSRLGLEDRLTPENSLSEQDLHDIRFKPDIYVQGGNGTPYWLDDSFDMDHLLAFDVFADDAPHKFLSAPIHHTDGKIYVQVRHPLVAIARHGTPTKFVRLEEGTYIDIQNPLNVEGNIRTLTPSQEVIRLTQFANIPGRREYYYQHLESVATKSAFVMHTPISVDQFHALMRHNDSLFGPTLLAKKPQSYGRYSGEDIISLTPLKQSFLVQIGGDTFIPLPAKHYAQFNPVNDSHNPHETIRARSWDEITEEMAYPFKVFSDYSTFADDLRANFLEVQYKQGKFFAHLKPGHALLFKDEDDSLKVLTDQDVMEIVPCSDEGFAATMLNCASWEVDILLKTREGQIFPFPEHSVIESATLKTFPVSFEQWEKEAFRGTNDPLNIPFTTAEKARFLKIEQGGLSQLPDGTTPQQPAATRSPESTMAAKAFKNAQKVERNRRMAPQVPEEQPAPKGSVQKGTKKPDFKPLPSHDPSLFRSDPESTPFGQDPEELPDYVIESMRTTRSMNVYQELFLSNGVPLNYIGPMKKFKSNRDGSIGYFVEVFHPFIAWDSGEVVEAGNYVNVTFINRGLSGGISVYSPDQMKFRFTEVVE